MNTHAVKLKSFLSRHERVLLPVSLALGFAIDSFTLRKADLLPETILIYAYLFLAGSMIFFIHLAEVGIFRGKFAERVAPLLPFVVTYAFGALFSAFVVFYTKSALLADSWPFILALIAVVVGLELFRQYRSKLIFNLTLYFLALFSFAIYSVPLWVGRMGGDVFLLSAVVAGGALTLFCLALFATARTQFPRHIPGIALSVSGAALAMILFYFTNLLPPVPLVLKDVGPFHSVVRDGNGYTLLAEPVEWFERFLGQTVHVVQGKPVYVFSAVYTPVRLETEIVHRWEYWVEAERVWALSTIVSYPAEGGREDGYRGYSFKRAILPGRWRVTVETPEGLKMGRTEFTVVEVREPTELSIVTR